MSAARRSVVVGRVRQFGQFVLQRFNAGLHVGPGFQFFGLVVAGLLGGGGVGEGFLLLVEGDELFLYFQFAIRTFPIIVSGVAHGFLEG